ncbi:2'-deoxymugineic-acid 2'-dioxygenase [Actinidia chinensis var. chinensis]|uniref:2'-deoxymugineic-acid 2'-dioxygenase n=1 Tax=Actinidia chinensis var. chinensis TaxID=1590841 RepID=A0A2R6PP77_ACTCC|nr:2'-deoxymugineic-acid 2'-dioxygenase [Actinidia chinensis var. chinensis]
MSGKLNSPLGLSSIQSAVPESYVLPPEKRPTAVPPCKTIPVIDLQGLDRDRTDLIQQIIKASQEYGFFQLTNHGVSEELMRDVVVVGQEFFELPVKEKERFYYRDPKQICKFKTSINYEQEEVHFWRENFTHPCHPLEDYIDHWPQNPVRYREVFGSYTVEVRKVGLLLLDLICEGLGLECGYFEGDLSGGMVMNTNYYPLCPDPSLVLGLPKHGDPYLLTLLNQGHVPGLQVLKDEQWLEVEPIPNTFVVNINHMLQIISNGKLKSADHRVVPSSVSARTTVVNFIRPTNDCLVGPAKSLLVKNCSPPLYKTITFGDFISTYGTKTHQGIDPLERVML